jgi:hypothetical protein
MATSHTRIDGTRHWLSLDTIRCRISLRNIYRSCGENNVVNITHTSIGNIKTYGTGEIRRPMQYSHNNPWNSGFKIAAYGFSNIIVSPISNLDLATTCLPFFEFHLNSRIIFKKNQSSLMIIIRDFEFGTRFLAFGCQDFGKLDWLILELIKSIEYL